MHELKIISALGPTPGMLEALKQYASVPDSSRDAMLSRLLKSALLRVQEFADCALLQCEVVQTSPADEETGRIRLYLGGGEVTGVSDHESGAAAEFTAKSGVVIVPGMRGKDVDVAFTTEPVQGDIERCMPTVLRYATALYDGEEQMTLNRILLEVLGRA